MRFGTTFSHLKGTPSQEWSIEERGTWLLVGDKLTTFANDGTKKTVKIEIKGGIYHADKLKYERCPP